jgi:hypothetical protein
MKAASARGSNLRNLCVAGAFVASMTASFSLSATEVKIELSGEQEVPPVATSASGNGALVFGTDRSVAGSVAIKGVVPTAVHIEEDAPGKRGVVIPLIKGAGDRWVVPARAKLTDAQAASLLAGNLYVNVRSDAHRNGELRGQVKP